MTNPVDITHTFSDTSKMPWLSYSLPAKACQTGGKLSQQKGTVCHKCYALKGFYNFRNVREAMAKRLAAIEHPDWASAMITQLNEKKPRKVEKRYFRWHDSGDLQSVDHLKKICTVAAGTPWLKHYLPTKERKFVDTYLLSGGVIPENLVIRISAPKVGDTRVGRIADLPIATVGCEDQGIHTCEARTKWEGTCGPCRLCWDKIDINYPLH